METLDYLRSGALLVAFLATAFASRSTWVLADTIATFTMGVGLTFFPEYLIKYQCEGTVDVIHLYLARVVGVMLLCSALNWYLSRKTKDETVVVGFMFSRVLSIIILLVAQVAAQYRSKGKQRFNDQHIYFGIFGCFLWMMGNLIHIFRSATLGGYSVAVNNRLCKHITIEMIITFAGAGMSYGFAQLMLESGVGLKDFKVDIIHVHEVRMIASLQVAAVFVAFTALNYENDQDKKNFLISRVVVYILGVCLTGCHHYKYPSMLKSWLVYADMYSMAALMLNAGLGIFWSDTKEKRK